MGVKRPVPPRIGHVVQDDPHREFLIDLPLCTDGAAPQRAPQTQRNKEHAR